MPSSIAANYAIVAGEGGDPVVPECRVAGEAVLDENCFGGLPGVGEVVDYEVSFLARRVRLELGVGVGCRHDGVRNVLWRAGYSPLLVWRLSWHRG